MTKPAHLVERSRPGSQAGSALVVSLIFMLLMTIIGVGAMQSSILQERMAGNVRDVNSAFQAAEAAVRAAEVYLQDAVVGPFNGANGLYRHCAPGTSGAACAIPDWRNPASTGWALRPGTLQGVAQQPEYIIQQLPPIPDPTGSLAADQAAQMIEVYRITARGFGASDNTMVVIQTMYRRG